MARTNREKGGLREFDRVVVNIDLPAVPAGSSGVVVGSSGLDWIRYRVRFDNGVERNLIDAKYLEKAPKNDRPRAKATYPV